MQIYLVMPRKSLHFSQKSQKYALYSSLLYLCTTRWKPKSNLNDLFGKSIQVEKWIFPIDIDAMTGVNSVVASTLAQQPQTHKYTRGGMGAGRGEWQVEWVSESA